MTQLRKAVLTGCLRRYRGGADADRPSAKPPESGSPSGRANSILNKIKYLATIFCLFFTQNVDPTQCDADFLIDRLQLIQVRNVHCNLRELAMFIQDTIRNGAFE